MSLEYEGLSSGYNSYEISGIEKRQSKVLYSREFLLSFSELVICKKLPSGFDPSILSEFEDAFHGVKERQRAPVGSQSQAYKRSEYSSSPPTRGDFDSYSRSNYVRWDSRSSGRSDRDSDSHSDKDADPGRHHVNPSQQTWKNSGHDGLLGSGSLTRPGYGSGNSSKKSGVTDDYQLNRNNGPYQPPRPYKAAPYSRRETKDSFNDETFGSTEGANEDRMEEERQRRASFELMRKEQHKVFEEKQKSNEKQTVNTDSGISQLLEDMKEENRDLGVNDLLHEFSSAAIPVNDSIKSSILSRNTMPRPLVPPGFTNAIGEKNSNLKPTVHTDKIEIAKSGPREVPLHSQHRSYETLDSSDIQSPQDHAFGDHGLKHKSSHIILLDKETKISPPYSFGVLEPKHPVGDNLSSSSTLSKHHDSFDDPEIVEVIPEVLENIFGSTFSIDANCSSSLAKKPEDTWTLSSVQSSKFAQWFPDEERKLGEDLTYGRPNDLLSLIVGGDKGMCQSSDEKYLGHFPSENSCKSSKFPSELISGLSSKSDDIFNHQSQSSKTEAIPSVLTCEDLEQTILSEYSDKKIPNLPLTEQSMQRSSVSDTKSEQLRGPVDNHASQHLLSLLHNDTGLNKMQLGPNMESRLIDVASSNEGDVRAALDETSEEGLKVNPVSTTLTLETLFGNAFMRELQSAEAPVSLQRGSVEFLQTKVSENLEFPLENEGSTHTVTNEVGQKSTSWRGTSLPLNQRQESISESWFGTNTSVNEPNSLKSLIDLNSRHNDVLEVDRYQLPEEEMFITKDQSSSNALINTVEKLAAIGAVTGEESSKIVTERSPFVHSPYNRTTEIPCGNLYSQPVPPQFQDPPMSHERQLPFPLDLHPPRIDSHMKFVGPESIIQHDLSANHQLPTNMVRSSFHHLSARVNEANNNSHNPILQQMRISGNHPPQLLPRFQKTDLPHLGNQPNELIPELSLMPGFPFGPHRPYNMNSSGLPIPAPSINNRSNHPEAFQRLLEMELRAKSKQIHTPPVHSQAIYNNEFNRLDMHFPYR